MMSYHGPMTFAPTLAPHARTLRLPNGLTIACADAGRENSSAVLLVHGLQDEADTWRHAIEPLAQHHRVVAVDLPGFGRSDKPKRRYTMRFFADTLLAVLDALHIASAHFVGNSLGAMICDWVAMRHPERVARLTLVDGTAVITQPPPTPRPSLSQMLFPDRADRRFFAALRRAPDDAYATLTPYYADLAALPEPDRTFLYRRVNERVWDEAQRTAALSTRSALLPFLLWNGRRLRSGAAALRTPTTVIWGAHDHILNPINGRARAALQAGARYIEIAGCGHLPQQERPAEFVRAVLDA